MPSPPRLYGGRRTPVGMASYQNMTSEEREELLRRELLALKQIQLTDREPTSFNNAPIPHRCANLIPDGIFGMEQPLRCEVWQCPSELDVRLHYGFKMEIDDA